MSKNLLWKTEVPKGHSSPCTWGNRIFVTARSGENLETICIDRGNGAVKWRQSIKPESFEKINGSNRHASSTPVTDGKHVYVYFGSFGLLAYDLDGKELWKRPLPVPKMQHGSASSPVLADGLVVINCDQKKDPYLLAVNQSTGEQVWKSTRPVTEKMWSWSTPVLWKHGDETDLVVLGREWLTAYDPKDGRERWRVEDLPLETASTPVYTDETLFATATVPFTGDPVNPIELPDFNELLERYDSNEDDRLVQAEISEDLALIYRLGPAFGVKKQFSRWDADQDGALGEQEWKRAASRIAGMRPQDEDALVAIRGGGEGDVTESHVRWKVSEGVGQIASPLVYRGRVYLVKHGGNVTCFNMETCHMFQYGNRRQSIQREAWAKGTLLCLPCRGGRQDLLLFILGGSGDSTSRGPVQDTGTK
jgi:outer membrane protein assembly factor BamB